MYHSITFNNGLVFHVPVKYQNLSLVGSGSQGSVCAAFDTSNGERVAIKKLSRAFQNTVFARRAYRELTIMKLMNHKNVVKLLDVFTPQTYENFQDIYLVMDFVEATLDSCGELNHKRLSFLLYQLLCGVKYLHSAGIIHRDLKPSNVGVNSNCTLKILDFGLSRAICHSWKMSPYVVTRYYRAPEIILGIGYKENVDIWSIGCIFGEIITGNVMFRGNDQIDQWNKIIELLGTPSKDFIDTLRPDIQRYVQHLQYFPPTPFENIFHVLESDQNPEAMMDLRDLLSKMLIIDPRQRMSVDQALHHPYVFIWYEAEEVLVTSPKYDRSIESLEYTLEQWKELIFAEIADFGTRNGS
ncbi:mitogen-activated protein kinase 9-like isoform X1 [Halyomorpha halys]|uniref:mitogen-activated protein kinase 9-like isoform X1 n=1 Tax=Halyomorpha halys TaxID=286706 RepID=UPI0006D52031|nr:mitogen-activated protein kinase 9-like [Halyomorpha halys]